MEWLLLGVHLNYTYVLKTVVWVATDLQIVQINFWNKVLKYNKKALPYFQCVKFSICSVLSHIDKSKSTWKKTGT